MSETRWLSKLSRLRVDRARGNPAPHKPLLLLALLTRLDEGEALPKILSLSPELAFRFLTLGAVVADRQTQRLDIRLPFHYLQSDGVWDALDRNGNRSPVFRHTSNVRLDPEFAAFLADERNRENAKLVLIKKYFQTAEQIALRELLNISEERILSDPDGSPILIAEAAQRGREARFRLQVVAAYNYTCALTGYRLNTVTGASVVDAAHIHSFAVSRNNDLRNGLALSKTAHWLFDEGAWSLTDDCRVLVAKDFFVESGPDPLLLRGYEGRTVRAPSRPECCPDLDHIRWHRNNVFEG